MKNEFVEIVNRNYAAHQKAIDNDKRLVDTFVEIGIGLVLVAITAAILVGVQL